MNGARVGAGALCSVLLAAACTERGAPTPGASAGRAAAPETPDSILVGATLPLTGPEAVMGGKLRDGFQLAFADAEKRGGLRVGNRKVAVRLKLLDDGNVAANAVEMARRLIEGDHVAALLGTYGTVLTLEQSAVAEQHRVPDVASTASASAVYRRGYKYLFGLQAPTEQMAYAEMRWIDNEQKAGRLPTPVRIAVAWEDTAYGRDFRAGVLDFATRTPSRKVDYQIVLDEPFPLGARDFAPLAARAKGARPHVFFGSAHMEDFLNLHKAVQAAHLCSSVISYGARGLEAKAQFELGADAVQGLIAASWWTSQLETTASKSFVQAFQTRYQRLPDYPEALGYEAARVLLAAIEKAGSSDREAIRAALETINLPTLLPGGSLAFPADTGRQARLLYVVQQVQQGGSKPVIYPRDLATGQGRMIPCVDGVAAR